MEVEKFGARLDEEVCRELGVDRCAFVRDAIVVEIGGKSVALYYTQVAQPHLRCELPFYEWCVHYDTCTVQLYGHRDDSMFAGFEWRDYHYKMDPARFVSWVLEHKVGTVKCCNYFNTAAIF